VNHKLVDANQRESALTARMADQLQELSIFGSVVDYSIVGISVADMRQSDEPMIYVNNAFTALTGYSRELAVGYNCRFLLGPDTDPVEVQKIRQAISEGRPYTGELINYRQDGTRFWNRLTLYPVGGVAGKPDFYVANQVDITSLKQQAGVPISELRGLETQLEEARQSLDDANRFGNALRERLAQPGDAPSSVEQEAFLLSEQQAHRRLEDSLKEITAVIQRHTRP
jgi:PAS domain S-box-containing protein